MCQLARVEWRRLILGRLASAPRGREHPVDLVNRECLGIKIADPVEHFFVAFVVRIVEGLCTGWHFTEEAVPS